MGPPFSHPGEHNVGSVDEAVRIPFDLASLLSSSGEKQLSGAPQKCGAQEEVLQGAFLGYGNT